MEGRMRKYGHASPERSKVRTPPLPKHQRHHHHQQNQDNQPPPPPPQQQARRIPVVYYLCRNRHLEHPHFIEVPTSSPEGLYLRDVINRLNVLRGKGMAAMYSWSCKRSYKNGFVWHDLSEDDLILPAHGNEYVLKGSELLDSSPSDRSHQSNTRSQNPGKLQQHQQEQATPSRSQEASPTSPGIVIKEAKPPPQSPQPSSPPPLPLPPPSSLPQEDELSPTLHRPSSSSGNMSPESKLNPPSWGGGGGGSPGLAEYMVYKANGAADASTQTEERGGGTRKARAAARDTRTRGISTDDGSLDLDFVESRQRKQISHSKESSEISRDEISPPATSSSTSSSGGKTETLESLIRADARKMNSFRILEEEEVFVPTGAKLKATNVLMQLITCGSISVKNHHSFGFVPTYKPRFSHVNFPSPMFSGSMMLGELDCVPENPRLMGLRLEEKEYFSGSLIETKKHKGEEGEVVPTLKRSSSYNAERSCKSPEPVMEKDRIVDSARSKCLSRTIKITPGKQSKNETMRSPILDGPRISSARLDCNQSTSLGSSKAGSKRYTDSSSTKGSSMRLECYKEEKEKVIKIEERLTSGARVIIQSRAPCDDSEDSSSS